MIYDTIVIGLGGMGSATAYQLARRGKRVLGFEQYTSGHTLGSSHGESRIIRQAYFEGVEYVPLLLRAYELWQQLEQDAGCSGELLHITGGLMIGAAESATFAGSLHSATTHHLPHEVLELADLRRRFPLFQPQQPLLALYEHNAGVLHPERTVQTHNAQAQRFGADLHFAEPVQHWHAHPDGSGVTVQTTRGSYTANTLVISGGAWAARLLADLELPLVVERQVMYWVQPQGGAAAFAAPNFPLFIAELSPDVQPYGFPAQDGPDGGVKVALFRDGPPCTPETLERNVAPTEFDRLRGYFAALIPALDAPLLRATACMYTTTPDEHFIVGLHPHHPQVAVAAGFSGHGYKFCSVMGEVLADLASAGSTHHPIELFAPHRFMAPTAD